MQAISEQLRNIKFYLPKEIIIFFIDLKYIEMPYFKLFNTVCGFNFLVIYFKASNIFIR